MNWNRLIDSIFKGNITDTLLLVKEAISKGISPQELLDRGLIAGMSVVGEKFKINEIFVPEVLIAAKAMETALNVLEPLLMESGVRPKGKIVIGTVKGDLHDIGKNLVAIMFKGAGFSVIDLGIDVAPERFISKAKEERAPIIAMSSLLTTSMPSMKETIDLLRTGSLNAKIKTIIGGAPVTQEYADEIGSDGYAPDASSAVDKVKELLNL